MAENSLHGHWNRFPSINALRTLDAIAKLGNMHAASEAMNVTPSAVSHQLRNLEAMLGITLVRRAGRRTEITSAGNRYLHEVRKALELIETASHSLSEEPSGKLRINCPPGFGNYWLAPRLGEFSALYPSIAIEVTSAAGPAEKLASQSDLLVQYGDGSWPELAVQHLSTPHTFPVCSPKLIERWGMIRRPEDLKKAPLIHHSNYTDWVTWLTKATKKVIDIDRGMIFSDMTHVVSAAIAGNGVAISDSTLAWQALEEGKLIQLFETEVPTQQSYFLVSEKDKLNRNITRVTVDWLVRAFQEHNQANSREWKL